jgi:Rrf2 family nitric oxide-sensitive transcriptional repressor
MPAESLLVNLKTLVLALEPHFDLVPCFSESKANCCIAPVCKLKMILYEARNAFLNVLEQFTLADIIENRVALQQLLNIKE